MPDATRMSGAYESETHANGMSENESKLRAAFCEVLAIPSDQITDDTSYGSKSWDSIGHMALTAAIDSTFDLTMDTDDLLDMSSYAKAKEILRRYGVEI